MSRNGTIFLLSEYNGGKKRQYIAVYPVKIGNGKRIFGSERRASPTKSRGAGETKPSAFFTARPFPIGGVLQVEVNAVCVHFSARRKGQRRVPRGDFPRFFEKTARGEREAEISAPSGLTGEQKDGCLRERRLCGRFAEAAARRKRGGEILEEFCQQKCGYPFVSVGRRRL